MVKDKLEENESLKGCYGTNEWSDNSGICRNCKLREECGKVNAHNRGE
jgi:hypothetical protein